MLFWLDEASRRRGCKADASSISHSGPLYYWIFAYSIKSLRFAGDLALFVICCYLHDPDGNPLNRSPCSQMMSQDESMQRIQTRWRLQSSGCYFSASCSSQSRNLRSLASATRELLLEQPSMHARVCVWMCLHACMFTRVSMLSSWL